MLKNALSCHRTKAEGDQIKIYVYIKLLKIQSSLELMKRVLWWKDCYEELLRGYQDECGRGKKYLGSIDVK